ncbi:glycoside hydrolase family 31 protein [Daldinia vernicosa]|uniref:glycoside hydrolase family 31 protein n=1 Tax=Daldinia vernicosa TaxID=114800 RepID=UPI002008DF0C|nr:glycoside hydrolase family 31 protein [Daldinia vernicosa]KAI0849221.1 glycoside hydrolase family 31 protein [Daldinia vernicosa]
MKTLVTLAAFVAGTLAVSVEDCPGYIASNIVDTDGTLTADLSLSSDACNVYGTDLPDLKLLVEYQTDTRLHVKIYDAGLDVYQVQEHILPRPSSQNVSSSDAALQFSLIEEPFSFFIERSGSGEVLFNTNGSQLVFESQYVYLRTQLPKDPNIYGLGEHTDSFRLPTEKYQRTFWNSESPFIPRHANLYGTHPMYLDHRGTSGSHGVFLLNSNGMDINIDQTDSGDQFLEYNIIGGILDFYFLAGPSPSEVSRQYAEVVGLPAMMSYWTFGFHQCKYGYWDVNYAAEVVANYSTANIPLETLWGDIDYMDLRQVFTTDPERFPLHKMRELVDTLHKRDQHYIMMLDPGIHKAENYSTFTRGEEKSVFLKVDGGSDYRGVQWAGEVVWPDWIAPNTQEWWTNEISLFFDPETGIDIDGAWNDMNEASNFCPDVSCDPAQAAKQGNNPPQPTNPPRNNTGRPIPGFPDDFQPAPTAKSGKLRSRQTTGGQMKGLPDRDLFKPKYRINNHKGELSDSTLYSNITNADGTYQYDTHNLYGLTMITATRNSLLTRRPGRRPFVLTRSSFAGAGSRAAHWFGDNNSTWSDYRVTIPQLLGFAALHQVPMVGSDVCGFNGVADEHMCARWALLGAFMPFYRNHADISAPAQEFYLWDLVAEVARKAIDARYRLLDYVYTAMYRASTTGEPIANPLFFVYPEDGKTFGIDTQFFYGDALLVSPVTEDYSESVTYYLPDDIFYDFWTLEPVRGTGATVTADNVTWTDIPVHIRGGTVLPLRTESANTTTLLRQNDFQIIVAPGLDGKAKGSLYLDDGDSLDVGDAKSDISFTWDGTTFKAAGNFGYSTEVVVESVVVLGGEKPVTQKGPWPLDGPFEVTF